MSTIIDLASRRKQKQSRGLPTREADFELQVWLDDAYEVDQAWIGGPFLASGPGVDHRNEHRKRVAGLLDAAWLYAMEGGHDSLTAVDRPVVWYFLDGDGGHTFLRPRSIAAGTGFKHFVWFTRQWWRVTKWWARLALRVARGRG